MEAFWIKNTDEKIVEKAFPNQLVTQVNETPVLLRSLNWGYIGCIWMIQNTH